MAELREVAAILDAGKIEESDLQSALQALLFHQCLYEDWPYPPAYRLIARHLAHVRPIFAAFGYRLVHHAVAHMLVLETDNIVYGVHMARLKKDETVVLLVLRLLYAEGISSLDDRGRVDINTDDIYDRLRAAGEEPPTIKRLIEILRQFQRKGLVRIGENDPEEQLTQLMIMPGITVLVSDVYVEGVIQWLERKAFDENDAEASGPATPESMLAHVADYRANIGSEPLTEQGEARGLDSENGDRDQPVGEENDDA
ncbi:DUF4194 domain-containing protein [Sphingomonas colocasiae]|uniref:DUF4194 domain-containing protein n=1 Tax=Sphingomonas colocasiae TaxID=1848973 RepID=A0ABS7PIG9_9SPHN|nr:DUF4194 domain-containing protein [Sphingomonas colocasiae]MBY8821091.1 DUF4194 domain-containing protein [Sphingomonas colocasiae]